MDDLGAYEDECDEAEPWDDNIIHKNHPDYGAGATDSAFSLLESDPKPPWQMPTAPGPENRADDADEPWADDADELWADQLSWADNDELWAENEHQPQEHQPQWHQPQLHQPQENQDDAVNAVLHADADPGRCVKQENQDDAVDAVLHADADPEHCVWCGEPCARQCPANSCVIHCEDWSCREHKEGLSDPNIDILVLACIPNAIVSIISLYPLSW